MPCKVKRACLQFCFRMRAVLLLLSHRPLAQSWPHTRLLLVLFDPVSAGLWPRVRKNRGLTPMQRFARWIAIRANPAAASGLSRKDLRHILYVIRLARRKRGLQIQSNPPTKNQPGKDSDKTRVSKNRYPVFRFRKFTTTAASTARKAVCPKNSSQRTELRELRSSRDHNRISGSSGSDCDRPSRSDRCPIAIDIYAGRAASR